MIKDERFCDFWDTTFCEKGKIHVFSRLQFSGILIYFNADFAMQISSECMKYDIEEYYCPTSSISMRKVHVNMILIENCHSRSL